MNTKRIVQLAAVVLLWTLVLVERGLTAAVAWAIVAAGIYGLVRAVRGQEPPKRVAGLNVKTDPRVPHDQVHFVQDGQVVAKIVNLAPRTTELL